MLYTALCLQLRRSVPSAEEKIQQLETLEREELVGKWIKAYGAPPFKGARQKTLIRGLAYHLQSRQYGGLPVKTSKRLIRIAKKRYNSRYRHSHFKETQDQAGVAAYQRMERQDLYNSFDR